jgi:hypothetical protein
MTGLLLVDSLDGLWMSRLPARADQTAALVSRIISVAIITISFTIGTWTLVRWVVPSLDEPSEAIGPCIGPAKIAVSVVLYL